MREGRGKRRQDKDGKRGKFARENEYEEINGEAKTNGANSHRDKHVRKRLVL